MRIIIDDVYVERGAAASAAASAASAALASSTPHAVLEGSLERGEGASEEESGEAAEMTDFFGFSDGSHLARGEAVGGVNGDGFSVAAFLPASKQRQQQQQQQSAGRGAIVQHHHHLRQRSPARMPGNAPAGSAFYVQQSAHDLSAHLGNNNVSCSQNAWDPAGRTRFSSPNDNETVLGRTLPLGVGIDSSCVTQATDAGSRYGYAAAAAAAGAASLGFMQRGQRTETAVASSASAAAASAAASQKQAATSRGGGGGGGGAPSTSGYYPTIS
ncbi:unnamed protein product, partial [Laminaria digitata]